MEIMLMTKLMEIVSSVVIYVCLYIYIYIYTYTLCQQLIVRVLGVFKTNWGYILFYLFIYFLNSSQITVAILKSIEFISCSNKIGVYSEVSCKLEIYCCNTDEFHM